MAEIIDLRGRQAVPASPPILADPSGRRARLLARTGRVIALVFLLWITGLALAGLGVLPAGFLPLAGGIGGQAAPPVIVPRPLNTQPTNGGALSGRLGSAVGPAVDPPAPSGGGGGGGGARGTNHPPDGSSTTSGSTAPVRSASPTAPAGSPGHTSVPVIATPPGSSGATGVSGGSAGGAAGVSSTAAGGVGSGHGPTTAPGQTVKTTAPGHSTTTTSPGNSAAAPGQTKQGAGTVTSPGQSGSAPGQTVPHGNGHGNGN